jgi:hypothetical protein
VGQYHPVAPRKRSMFEQFEKHVTDYLFKCKEKGAAQFEHGIQTVLMHFPFLDEKALRKYMEEKSALKS